MASRNFKVDIDLEENQILNAVLHKNANPTANITGPAEGQVAYDDTADTPVYFNGTTWQPMAMVAGTNLEISSGAMRIAAAAAGSGLGGGGASALSINTGSAATTGLEINSDTLRIANGGLGAGLLGGSGSVISIDTTTIATRSYVDGIAQGLDAKDSVKVASTANVASISTALNSGDTIDGVTLGNGDRVLLKDQTTTAENGIYVAGVVPARSADANLSGELSGGSYVWVEEGTVNADSGWIISTPSGVVDPGVTSHTWTQFSGAGQITAGSGLTKTGNTLDVAVGDGIQIVSDSVRVTSDVARKSIDNAFTDLQTIVDNDVTRVLDLRNSGGAGNGLVRFQRGASTTVGSINSTITDGIRLLGTYDLELATGGNGDIKLIAGGTGNIDAGSMRVKSVANAAAATDAMNRQFSDGRYPAVYTANVGNGSSTSFNIDHNFGTNNVLVEVYTNAAPYDTVDVDVERSTTNRVVLTFNTAPVAPGYNVVVMGIDGSPS